ncbi:MAG TPA: NAD-dependent epimerase/dehydratase family protein [Acetobacteraceae bacterium]|nr:NAD-dependent epimerase/dehydratase family protein [Acetobacteraceae bacterium]
MSLFTLLGADGLLGRTLATRLCQRGHGVTVVPRDDLPRLLAARHSAGHVIHCLAPDGDFRAGASDTAEAHVGVTARCLRDLAFDSFLFISSTRVYAHAVSAGEEDALLALPGDPADLGTITRLAAEALCLCDARPAVRVARVADTYGPGMGAEGFLGQLIAEAWATGTLRLRQGPLSCRDYIAVEDAADALAAIAMRGQHRLYNVATGVNISHGALVDCLADAFGWQVARDLGAPAIRSPRIRIVRLAEEFGAPASTLLTELAQLPFALRPQPDRAVIA